MNNKVIHAIYQMHKQPIIDQELEVRIFNEVVRPPSKKRSKTHRVMTKRSVGTIGLKGTDYKRLIAAIRWLIAMLVDSVRGGKARPIVIPLGHPPYTGRLFGYKVVQQVLVALEVMQYIRVRKARPNMNGGYATTIIADKRLERAYSRNLIPWVRHSNDKHFKEVRLNGYDDFLGFRYTVEVTQNDQVKHWANNVAVINEFTQNFAIFLLEDDLTIWRLLRDTYLDFTETRYRRIFCRERFDRGGRFYGPWWQFIKKEYRSTISINQEPTVEYDYSGMGINLVYAKLGLKPLPDPYDLGLPTDNQEKKRDVIKEGVLALLNDKDGKYRFSREQLKTLGLTNLQAMNLIEKKHSAVSHLFRTDVGMETQFTDSNIAERVLLEGVRLGILILSVHDSFLVQGQHEEQLIAIMEQAYYEEVGSRPKIKKCKKERVPQEQFADGDSHYRRFFHETYQRQTSG